MQSYLLVTIEILIIVVIPLLVLYLKGNWPMREVVPSLVIIAIFWSLFGWRENYRLSTYSKVLVRRIRRWCCMDYAERNSSVLATTYVSCIPLSGGHNLFDFLSIYLQKRFSRECFFCRVNVHAVMSSPGI